MSTTKPFGAPASGFYHPFIIKLTPDLSTILYVAVMGGSMGEGAGSLAVDSGGNAYLIGTTNSSDFPTMPHTPQPTFGNKLVVDNNARQDAYILKLDPKGATLVYSTYVGGSGDDQGTVLTIDSTGTVYAAGDTTSPNFPITPGGLHLGLVFVGSNIYQSNWVAKLSPDVSIFNLVAAVGGNTSLTTPNWYRAGLKQQCVFGGDCPRNGLSNHRKTVPADSSAKLHQLLQRLHLRSEQQRKYSDGFHLLGRLAVNRHQRRGAGRAKQRLHCRIYLFHGSAGDKRTP
jgi:hypothetical protein